MPDDGEKAGSPSPVTPYGTGTPHPDAWSVLPVLGPFSWGQMIRGIENFLPMSRFTEYGSAGMVRLAFRLDTTFEAAAVAVRPDPAGVALMAGGDGDAKAARAQAARILSLDCDASTYPEVGERDPAVGRIMAALPGLRPLCFPSPYECAAWAVISQRISMRQAAAIQRRLVEAHGERVAVAGGEALCFPHPETLAALSALPGLPAAKIERLHGVARAALGGVLDAGRLLAVGREDAGRELRTIPGIGPFWADGIYLRALGVKDVFPDEPVSVAALGALHGLGTSLTPEQIAELTAPLAPWRMWVCYLLRVAAGSAGLIPGIRGREMELRRGARGGRARA